MSCESKTEKQLNQLYKQANGYLNEGDYEGAITVFNQMLELKDDPMVKEKLDNVLLEKLEDDIRQLNLEADDLLEKGELEEALKVINQMLEKKDDPKFRERLEEIKAEVHAVKIVKKLIVLLKNIQDNIDYSPSSAAIMKLIKPTKELIDQLDEIKLSSGSDIASYINSLNNNPVYQLYKSDYMSGKTIESRGYEDSVIVSTKRFRVKVVIDEILKVEFPSKYK